MMTLTRTSDNKNSGILLYYDNGSFASTSKKLSSPHSFASFITSFTFTSKKLSSPPLLLLLSHLLL